MIYIPILGAFLEATGTIIQKKVLRKHHINVKNYLVYGFLANILVMLPFTYLFWRLQPEATQLINLLIFIFIIITSIFANIFVIYSLKKEDISEIEPIRLMQPLFTILITFILSFFLEAYISERNFYILGLSLVASISLTLAHIDKNHLKFNKYSIAALIGSFLFAVELAVSKQILPYYSLLTFYFLRCLLIFLFSWIVFQPKISSIKTKTKIMILIGAIVWIFYRMVLYYGYLTLGVIFTTMLFILAPIFIYLFAKIFLKEKIELRQIISSLVVVICIVLSLILGR